MTDPSEQPLRYTNRNVVLYFRYNLYICIDFRKRWRNLNWKTSVYIGQQYFSLNSGILYSKWSPNLKVFPTNIQQNSLLSKFSFWNNAFGGVHNEDFVIPDVKIRHFWALQFKVSGHWAWSTCTCIHWFSK